MFCVIQVRDALYDIHEYADILHKNHKNYIDVEGLAELILERVDFICEQLGMPFHHE